MGEASVELQTGAAEGQKLGAWAATKRAFSGIAAALDGRAKSEVNSLLISAWILVSSYSQGIVTVYLL
uniref:Uncharacterized protein n=1 Tax=Ascaris lumbricoides TaxID=6252 RepID=A0A0M3HZ90_ASCLU